MKKFAGTSFLAVFVLSLLFPLFSLSAQPVDAASACKHDLNSNGKCTVCNVQVITYKKSGNYIANWGKRDEACTFLSPYAKSFYTGSYTYEALAQKSGGTTQTNASSSALYSNLKSLMTSKHSHQTSYGETRDQYRYTDCVNNDTNHISSFYSGTQLNGSWGSSPSWNREHTWPNSKGLGGNDENDIMMLRPTATSENSSRGNTAYGTGGSFYDPNSLGKKVRGDCARIVLYVYTRWGNTSYMWGSSGVMQNMDTLLKWMAEDPVDTWEMGRNDAVQAITGTRNVFVDYPEFAWKLFGKSVPANVSTPSGQGNSSSGNNNSSSSSVNTTPTNYALSTLKNMPAGTNAIVKGAVIAVAKTGFIFNDGTASMFFFTGATQPTVQIGDEIEVKGKTSAFGGQIRFASSDGANYTKKDVDVPAYVAPTPTVWTSAQLNAFNGTAGQYVQVTAKIYKNGGYIRAEQLSSSDNKRIALLEPTSDILGDIVLSNTPQEFVITGYTCYVSGSTPQYAYLLVTDIQPTSSTGNSGNSSSNDSSNSSSSEVQDGNAATPTPIVPIIIAASVVGVGGIATGLFFLLRRRK